jgi:hypothetical protein
MTAVPKSSIRLSRSISSVLSLSLAVLFSTGHAIAEGPDSVLITESDSIVSLYENHYRADSVFKHTQDSLNLPFYAQKLFPCKGLSAKRIADFRKNGYIRINPYGLEWTFPLDTSSGSGVSKAEYDCLHNYHVEWPSGRDTISDPVFKKLLRCKECGWRSPTAFYRLETYSPYYYNQVLLLMQRDSAATVERMHKDSLTAAYLKFIQGFKTGTGSTAADSAVTGTKR